MPARTPRLNRRRYVEVVRLLKETITNRSVALKVRLNAADTLLSIYDRHDRQLERKGRTAESELTTASEEPIPVVEPETAEQIADRLISTYGRKDTNASNGN
jgi:hypothetical protein